mmetsp:Transcript_20566/g.49798  ORF Transcript_20566/g.49798 Transcript_20566/m.49798 type:complete len:283 (-) Transcript_20566:1955-2803(-)
MGCAHSSRVPSDRKSCSRFCARRPSPKTSTSPFRRSSGGGQWSSPAPPRPAPQKARSLPPRSRTRSRPDSGSRTRARPSRSRRPHRRVRNCCCSWTKTTTVRQGPPKRKRLLLHPWCWIWRRACRRSRSASPSSASAADPSSLTSEYCRVARPTLARPSTLHNRSCKWPRTHPRRCGTPAPPAAPPTHSSSRPPRGRRSWHPPRPTARPTTRPTPQLPRCCRAARRRAASGWTCLSAATANTSRLRSCTAGAQRRGAGTCLSGTASRLLITSPPSASRLTRW